MKSPVPPSLVYLFLPFEIYTVWLSEPQHPRVLQGGAWWGPSPHYALIRQPTSVLFYILEFAMEFLWGKDSLGKKSLRMPTLALV